MKLIIAIFLNISFYFGSCFGETGHFYLTYLNGSDLITVRGGSPLNKVGVKWLTQAFYNNSVNSTGWDILEIITNPEISDNDQAYYAGWTEGFLTQKHIYYHWYNTQKNDCNKIKATCDKIRSYLTTNMGWVITQIQHNKDDPYWHQVNLYYRQLRGLYAGYQQAVTDKAEKLMEEDILLLNYVTDLMTLKESLAVKSDAKHIKKSGHCSVLIKLLPGFTDVFFAHNAWITYNFMNRVVKRYNFAYHLTETSNKLISGQSQAFSSYAGVITSIDDFYIINSGLFVTETTNNVYNMKIYEHNKPTGQVLESVRSMVANRLSRDGESWSYYYSLRNSGTYNNQWMVVDLKKFRPGFQPEKGFLWVLEQMPGKIEHQDQTQHILAHSYWASYNIPFYKNIFDYSGYDVKEKQNGSYYSYKECSRAKIFAREQETVVDLDSMIKAIRYNHYETDPYSVCEKCNPKANACMAVASRCDLNPKNGTYSLNGLKFEEFGAIDAKIGSYSLFKKGEMVTISGPTWRKGLEPFQWSKTQASNMSHLGQPDKWDFTPLTTSWILSYVEANPNEEIITVLKTKTQNFDSSKYHYQVNIH